MTTLINFPNNHVKSNCLHGGCSKHYFFEEILNIIVTQNNLNLNPQSPMLLLSTAPNLTSQIEALCLRSSAARLRADSDVALSLATEAWALAGTAPAENIAVRLNAIVELTLFHLDNAADYPTALRYAFEWKRLADIYAVQSGDTRWIGFALNVMGDCHHRAGNTHKALAYYTEALPLRMIAGNDADIGWTFHNYSATFNALGNAALGNNYALAAHKHAQQSGEGYGQASTLSMLGANALAQHQYPQAWEHLSSAETLLRANNYTHRLPDVLNRMAAVMRSTGKHTQALELLHEAETISMNGELRALLAASYREHALMLNAVKEFSKAEQLHAHALSLEDALRGASVQHRLATVEAELSPSLDVQSASLLGLPSLLAPPPLQVQPTKRKQLSQSSTHATLLTPAEWRVARLLAENWSYDDIADTLHISARTAETHRTNIINKLKEHYGISEASNRDITRFVHDFG